MAFKDSLLGGLTAGAADSAIGGAVGQAFGAINVGRQWKYAKKQMDYAAQIWDAQFSRQSEMAAAFRDNDREYNSAYNQRRRLEAAGINPFANGLSELSSTSNTPSPSMGGSGASGSPVSSSVPYQIDPMILGQLDVLKSQANLNNAKADEARGNTKDPGETLRGQRLTNNLEEQRVINERTAGKLQQFDLDFKEASRSNNLATIEATLANIRKENDVLNADLQNKLDQHENNPYIRQEIQSRIFMNVKQSAMLEAQRDLLRKNIEVADTDIWLKLAEASNLREMNEVIRQQGISAKADAELKAFEAEARTGAGTWSGRGGALFVERLRSVISAIYGGKR